MRVDERFLPTLIPFNAAVKPYAEEILTPPARGYAAIPKFIAMV
jgi:hypothetical protein